LLSKPGFCQRAETEVTTNVATSIDLPELARQGPAAMRERLMQCSLEDLKNLAATNNLDPNGRVARFVHSGDIVDFIILEMSKRPANDGPGKASIPPSAPFEAAGSTRNHQAEPLQTFVSKYCFECGSVIREKAEICPKCGVRQISVASSGGQSSKSKLVAALLAILLGGLGLHKFYLDRPVWGVIYLLFCWTFIPAFVGFIEGIIYLCTSDAKFAAKYG
jgi:TM2 domain-containing membrane protein YozV